MPFPLQVEARLEGRLQQTLGSFWTSVFKETDKVRVLIDSLLRTRVIGDMLAAAGNFAGDRDAARLVRHVEIDFKPSDVIETGTQVYGDPDFPELFGTNLDANTFYGRQRIKYWALPVKSIIPVSVQARDRQWIIGSDFFIHDRRYIFFREDPRIVFPDGHYLVVRGYRTQYNSALSFFTGVDGVENEDLIVNYLRRSQTPGDFRLALCAVAGLAIIRKGGQLIHKTQFPNGDVIYTFDDEMVRVDYEHEHLVEGETYAPLTVVGDIIKAAQAGIKPSSWWRQIDWKGGLALDPIVPGFPGLPLPDSETVAYVAGQDENSVNGSQVHARLKLTNDFHRETAYWEKVAKLESASGLYFNNILGLREEVDSGVESVNDTFAKLLAHVEEVNKVNQLMGLEPEQPSLESLPNIKWVNALDTFFQAVLDPIAFVISFDQRRLKRQKQTFDFMARELPVGGTPIIIGFVSGIRDDADKLDRDLVVKETVTITNLTPVSVEDTVNLEAVQERVSILQETVLY